MTFHVRWDQTALDELATAWMRADSAMRPRITQVAHAIDQKLQTHPLETGESREEGERIVIALPLGLICEIDEAASLVRVTHVWIIPRRV